jgi:hypothetical protein
MDAERPRTDAAASNQEGNRCVKSEIEGRAGNEGAPALILA